MKSTIAELFSDDDASDYGKIDISKIENAFPK